MLRGMLMILLLMAQRAQPSAPRLQRLFTYAPRCADAAYATLLVALRYARHTLMPPLCHDATPKMPPADFACHAEYVAAADYALFSLPPCHAIMLPRH